VSVEQPVHVSVEQPKINLYLTSVQIKHQTLGQVLFTDNENDDVMSRIGTPYNDVNKNMPSQYQ
jgi:hypothetical protein